MTESLVRLSNVGKSYDEGARARVVLTNIDVSFERGSFIVLLGKSGSGKSTLLNLLSGIDLPTQGEIRVDGVNLARLSEEERTLFRRHHIGFVFQSYNLLPTLDVAENLALPLELVGRKPLEIDAAVDGLLTRTGLRDRKNDFADTLSGGEQQRVAVARALIHRPKLLLADEPTGNLDSATGELILDLLDELRAQLQTTVIVVTHDRDLTRRADRVFELSLGTLHESRSPAP